MHTNSQRKKGFSLIELLVVIAIIAILAAILFPIFLSAKEKGRQAACQSNMKQWGSSFDMYCGDYNDFFVPACWTDDSGNIQSMWSNTIQPYVKNRGIFWCPAKGKPNVNSRYLEERYIHYGLARYHAYLYGGSETDAGIGRDTRFDKVVSRGAIKTPTRCIVLAETWRPDDAYSNGATKNKKDLRFGFWCAYPIVDGGTDELRHNGGCNIMMADSHSRWMKAEQYKNEIGYWRVDGGKGP